MIFDTLGWHHEYEKAQTGVWDPDFYIQGGPNGMTVLAEVKSDQNAMTKGVTEKMTSPNNRKFDLKRYALLQVWDSFPVYAGHKPMRFGYLAVWDWFSGQANQQWVWGDAIAQFNPYGTARNGKLGRWELWHSRFNQEVLWHGTVTDTEKNWWGE